MKIYLIIGFLASVITMFAWDDRKKNDLFENVCMGMVVMLAWPFLMLSTVYVEMKKRGKIK